MRIYRKTEILSFFFLMMKESASTDEDENGFDKAMVRGRNKKSLFHSNILRVTQICWFYKQFPPFGIAPKGGAQSSSRWKPNDP